MSQNKAAAQTAVTKTPVIMTAQDVHTLMGAYISDYRDISIANYKAPLTLRGIHRYPTYEAVIAWHVALAKLPRDNESRVKPFNAAQALTGMAQYFNFLTPELLREGYYLQRLNTEMNPQESVSVPALLRDIAANEAVIDNEAAPYFNNMDPDFLITMQDVAKKQMERTVSIASKNGKPDQKMFSTEKHLAYVQNMHDVAFSTFPQEQAKPTRKNLFQRLLGL